jgi:hypothetical protein
MMSLNGAVIPLYSKNKKNALAHPEDTASNPPDEPWRSCLRVIGSRISREYR